MAQAVVSAGEPDSILGALIGAGYKAEKLTDNGGDPMIAMELEGMPTQIYFYGCDDATHDQCDSLQFSTGFDRAKPWNAADAIVVSKRYRFASVSLDDEGDPYITWDINIGEGIPASLFLKSLRDFSGAVSSTANLAFAEERANAQDSPAK